MRTLFILSFLALFSCTQVPEKVVDNPKCAGIKSILVLRVMDNYFLGWVDDEVPYSTQIKYDPTDEHFVFFLKEPDEIYYPKQRIVFSEEQCLIYNGNYNYKKNDTVDRTVLIGKLEPKHLPNPEYLRIQNEKRLADINQIRENRIQQINKQRKADEKRLAKQQAHEEYLKNSCWIKRRNHQKCPRAN